MRQPSAAQTGEVLLLVGVLIALVMIAAIAILIMRKRLLGPETGAEAGSFLDDLRAARNRGEITPEEFDAARARMIEKLKGSGTDAATALRPKKPRENDAGTDTGAGSGPAA